MMRNLLILTVLGTSTLMAEWPQYRGPNKDGTTAGKIATSWPADGPKTEWRVKTPNGFSSIAVSNGRAFTFVTREGRETLVALDAGTGRELWVAAMTPADYGHNGGNAGARGNQGGDGARSTPSVDGGHVYALSADLILLCVDAKTGQKVWQRNIIAEFEGAPIKWKNAASPLLDGGLVYVGGGGAGQSLIALNKVDGKVAWKTGTETITHATPVIADIHGVRQVIFFTQSGLVSLESVTGKLLWKQSFKFAVSTAASPVVEGNLVFCSAGYGVGGGCFRVDHKEGKWTTDEAWRIPGNAHVANHWSTPVVKNGHLYGLFGFKKYGDGPLKCVELATGKIKWEQEGFGAGNVILVDGNVLALTDFGEVVLAKATPEGYREMARTKAVGGKCWSTPTTSGGRVFVRSTTEAVCLNVAPKAARR
tara:strand:+ start:26747 stop:28012 length:1266 start_codon:yes stop_codon:yes gene_type:complete